MKMKRKDSFMGRFHRDSPRLWAVSIFPVVCLLTVIGLPIAFAVSVCKDIPRIVRNLYGDVSGCLGNSWRTESKPLISSWKGLWLALRGKVQSQSSSGNAVRKADGNA